MVKPFQCSYVLMILVLFFTVETMMLMKGVEGDGSQTCQISSLGCENDIACNEQCIQRYNAHGACYNPVGVSFLVCMCYLC